MTYTTASGIQIPQGTDAFNPPAQFKTWADKAATYENSVTVSLDSDRLALASPELRDGLACYVMATKLLWRYDGGWTLGGQAAVILSRNAAAFTLATGIGTQVTNVALDTTKAVGVTTSGGAITIATAGDYQVNAQAQFAANATGIRTLDITKNSTDPSTGSLIHDIQGGSATIPTTVRGNRLVTLAAGDVLRMILAQNSGGNLALLNGASELAGTFFEVVKA